MITFKVTGNTNRTQKFLQSVQRGDIYPSDLDSIAKRGVEALRAATPASTGLTAASWDYEIKREKDRVSIYWTNSSRDPGGPPVVVLLQYGHGTGTGGYVAGRDFINPAIKPIFDEIADAVWKKVTSA